MSCCAHRNILTCLVLSMETRLGPRVVAMEASPSRLPLLSQKWKRLLRDPVRAPDSSSCPEEASASKLAQEGFLFLWVVLSCVFSPVGAVMSCPVCLALEGSWYPLTTPGRGGRKGSGCRGQGPEDNLPWPPEPPAPPWPPICLFCSGGPRPVFLSMSVLRGLQSTHPPSPVELLRRGSRLPGGGSNVSPLSCVSCVPTSCVHIWFVSCPR